MLLLTTRRPVPPARLPRLRACSFEDAEDPFTFAITQRALTLVGSGLDSAHMDLLVAAFVFKLLSHVGYRPDFSACVLCGDPMLSYFFAPGGRPHVRLMRVERSGRRAGVDRRGRMAACPHVYDVRWPCGRADRSAYGCFLLGLSHVWAATHTDQRLRAMEFMLGR